LLIEGSLTQDSVLSQVSILSENLPLTLRTDAKQSLYKFEKFDNLFLDIQSLIKSLKAKNIFREIIE